MPFRMGLPIQGPLKIHDPPWVWHGGCPRGCRTGAKVDVSRRAWVLGAFLLGGVWLLVGGRSLWFDELFALHAASRPVFELVAFIRDHDAHPPLFYFLLRVWTGLWGTSEMALRAPSGLSAIATVAVVAGLAQRRLGGEAAVLAVGALATSPLFLQASTEATRYTFLTLLYVLAAREVLRGSAHGAKGGWKLSVWVCLLLYTHYLGVVLVGSLVVFSLWEGGPAGFRRVARACGMGVLGWSPWFPVLWHHLAEGRFDPPWRPALPATLPLQVLHVVGFGGRVFGTASYFSTSGAGWWTEVALAVPVLVLLGIALWAVGTRSTSLARMAICCAGVPTLVLLGVSVWKGSMVAYPRYFVFTLPFLALAVGSLASPGVPGAARAVAGICGALVLALAVGSLAAWAANPTAGAGDRRQLARELRARLQQGDAVLVYPRWESAGVEYYLPELRGRYLPLPSEWTQGAVRALEGQVQASAGSERVWVVQGPPISPGAFDALYRQLSRTHRVAYFGEFDGLRLTLFVRRTKPR